MYNWALKEGFKELTKALFEEVSGVAFADANFLYTVINLSVDIALEVSGKAAEASAHEDFITQLDCFNMAVTSYRNAFDTVYEGDHSKEALNRLTATFLLTKSACIKAHQTMLTMGWVSPYEDKYTEISTYIEKIENTKIY